MAWAAERSGWGGNCANHKTLVFRYVVTLPSRGLRSNYLHPASHDSPPRPIRGERTHGKRTRARGQVPERLARQRRGAGELGVPETNHAPPSAAAFCSLMAPGLSGGDQSVNSFAASSMQTAALRFSHVPPAKTTIKMPATIRNGTNSSTAVGAMNKMRPTPRGGAIPKRYQTKQSGLRIKRLAPETRLTGRMRPQELIAQRIRPDHAGNEPGPDENQQASVIPGRTDRTLGQDGPEGNQDDQRRNAFLDGPLEGAADEFANESFVVHQTPP